MEFKNLQLIEQFHTTKMPMNYWEEKEARASSNTGFVIWNMPELSIFIFTCLFSLHWNLRMQVRNLIPCSSNWDRKIYIEISLASKLIVWYTLICENKIDAVSLDSTNKLSPCHLPLKRLCTFFCAQWNSRIWSIGSGKQKSSMPKRADFQGDKFGYILCHFLK